MKLGLYSYLFLALILLLLYNNLEHFHPTSQGTILQLHSSRPYIGMPNSFVPLGRMHD